MPKQTELITSIRRIAEGRFGARNLEEFLETFELIVADEEVIGSVLQISTDEGDELEIGFFTKDNIADITLSNGKVYSCTYPLSKVQELYISDLGSKWALTILGEKKFDYNVVKPGPIADLKKYEASLKRKIQLTNVVP